MIEEEKRPIPYEQRVALIDSILDETMGYGALEPLLRDPSITEIMVNAPDEVYIERGGRLILSDVRLESDQKIEHIIERIVAPLGRRIDESSPMVDARLPDGSRVNAVIPPLAIDGPTITIRRFREEPFTSEDLVRNKTMTREMRDFLDLCVKARINVIVSGGTGAGKTTTLNVLSTFLPSDERVVTVEDSAELRFHERRTGDGRRPHVVRLEARPPNIEGEGEVSIQQLVRNSLRMRPNRIIVGEVRGGEALDMLQAMNTGHEGSLTTIHANSPRDALARLEMLVSMSGQDLPMSVVRQHIETIEVILQQDRMPDGTRRVTNISEFHGYDDRGRPEIKDIYRFEIVEASRQDPATNAVQTIGYFQATDFEPDCTPRLLLYLRGEKGREEARAYWENLMRPDERVWVNKGYLTEEEKRECDV
jgi:pilus assembly protein CpaF